MSTHCQLELFDCGFHQLQIVPACQTAAGRQRSVETIAIMATRMSANRFHGYLLQKRNTLTLKILSSSQALQSGRRQKSTAPSL